MPCRQDMLVVLAARASLIALHLAEERKLIPALKPEQWEPFLAALPLQEFEAKAARTRFDDARECPPSALSRTADPCSILRRAEKTGAVGASSLQAWRTAPFLASTRWRSRRSIWQRGCWAQNRWPPRWDARTRTRLVRLFVSRRIARGADLFWRAAFAGNGLPAGVRRRERHADGVCVRMGAQGASPALFPA